MQPIYRLLLTSLCLSGGFSPVMAHAGATLRSGFISAIVPTDTLPNQSLVSQLGDDPTGEIEQIIGETENSIMQGIQDELTGMLGNMLSQFLDVSPISAVKSLQSMVKDGLSKQQKIEYQNYKVDYAWKKAHTELSPAFATYYQELNLNQLTTAIKTCRKAADTFLNSPAFSTGEATAMQQALDAVGNTDDLVAEVKTVVNLGGKPIWMSEGERLSALNSVRTDLYDRIKRINQLLTLVRATYQYRSKEIARNAYRQHLYRPNSTINRTTGTRPTTYQTR